MSEPAKRTVTSIQTMMIVLNTIIGAGVTTLPRDAGNATGTPDAWISIILGGMIALLAGYVVTRLSLRFPGETFFQYSRHILGKPAGTLLALLLSVYFLMISAWQIRAMGELIRFYLLNNTPIEMIMLIFLWIGIYLVGGGIEPIARFCEIVFIVILLSLISVLLLSMQDFKLDYLRPVLGEGIAPVISGVKSTSLSFTGFEVMLIIPAFMAEPKKAVKAAALGISMVVVLYALIVFVSYGVLSFDEVRSLTWPLMSLAKSIDIPGAFFNRFEILISVMWVIANYTSFVPNFYLGCLGMSSLSNLDYRLFMFAMLPFIYIVAAASEHMNAVFKLGSSVAYFDLIIGGAIPVLCLIIAMVRRIGIAHP
jgi:spore germination protein